MWSWFPGGVDPLSLSPLPLGLCSLRAGEGVLLETHGSPLNRLLWGRYL